ncbi:MAG TPA: type II toxin-antitoxin system VapC family toxin [Gemmatimonadaceae bacterium]
MIVVDVNVIAYLILPGEHTARAEAVFESDSVWVVPPLWASEMRSVLSHYVRGGKLSVAQASLAMERAEALVGDREAPVVSREVLSLADKSGCSSYDCEYVALAMSLGVSLITSDKAVLRAFPRVAMTPGEMKEDRP